MPLPHNFRIVARAVASRPHPTKDDAVVLQEMMSVCLAEIDAADLRAFEAGELAEKLQQDIDRLRGVLTQIAAGVQGDSVRVQVGRARKALR
jgi:hypothetical protein